MKKAILILISFLVTGLVYAQDPVNSPFAMQGGDYHSPEVQAMTRYGQIPVNCFTGSSQIDIPLYETDVKGFKLGVSVSYNTSGIKVDDIASIVGLGWVLNAGGVISRSVNGLADESGSKGLLHYDLQPNQLSNDYYLRNMYHTLWGSSVDVAADVFTYNFMGYSGKFSFGRDKKIYLLPFADLKIEFVNGTYFKVQTEEGHTFLFEETETTIPNGHGQLAATTAWHLTKIILNNNGGEITFSYLAGASFEERFPSYSASRMEIHRSSGANNFASDMASEVNGTHLSFSTALTSAKYLRKINLGTYGEIVFEYDDDTPRLDFRSGKILRSVKAYSYSQLVRHWEFSQQFKECGDGYQSSLHNFQDRYRMFLESLSEVSVSTDKQVYRMEYNSTKLPCRKTFGKDLWGYYNGKYEQTNGIYVNPQNASEVSLRGFPAGIGKDRKGNETYMKAGSLVRLTYPTKGYTLFEYEGHQISASEKAGGLRIKSIKNYADDGTLAESKFFKYGKNEDGIAKISSFQYNENFKSSRGGFHYAQVLNTEDARYTIYTLSDSPFYSSYVGYEAVTEYLGDPSAPEGKTEYRYDFKMDEMVDNYQVEPNSILFVSNAWQNGRPKEIKSYARTSNGYIPVRKEVNVYNRFHLSQGESYCVNILYSYEGDSGGSGDNYTNMHGEQLYSSTFVPVLSETIKKMKTTVTDYIHNGNAVDSIVNVTGYSYGGLAHADLRHGFPTVISNTDSSGEEIKTEHRYLSDIVGNSTAAPAAYREMYNRNMVSIPLETLVKRKGKVTRAQVNLFKQDSYGNIVPKERKMLETAAPLSDYQSLAISSAGEQTDSRLVTEITYYLFNAQGRLLEHSGKDKIRTVTLWGYNHQYPVIRVEGATFDEVKQILGEITINSLSAGTDFAHTDALIAFTYSLLLSHYSGMPVQLKVCIYRPSIGVSMIGVNSQMTYYEYDSAGRLTKERDAHGTKAQYEYHYKD